MIKKIISTLSIVRYSLLIAVLIFSSLPLPAAAVDIQFFQSNDILYYDGSSGNPCTTVGASYSTRLDIPSLSGNDNAEKIWNFLKEQQLTDEQAAGVMGNIQQESGFNPGAKEVVPSWAGQGFGIMQWTGGRRTELESFASDKNMSASDLSLQLLFLLDELRDEQVGKFSQREGRYKPQFGQPTDNLWEAIKKQTTILDATILFHDGFLRSADTTQQIEERRGGYATTIFEKFSGRSVAGGVSGSGAGNNCSAAGSGDLIATLMEYAHPTHTPYAGNNRVDPEPMPAYAEVTRKLVGEGKWVGGGQGSEFEPSNPFPGIDCGGFVSVLLTQSGFEPDYNFGLDMGRGSSNQRFGQRPWAERHWTYLGEGGEINVADLRPGDVAYSSGHTFVFVGQVDGFESQFASASYRLWRAPMAAGSWEGGYETAVNPEYSWYGRRGGTKPAYGETDMSDPVTATNIPYTNT